MNLKIGSGRQNTSRVLVARLLGGLGNQLFVYATGRALALATGRDLMLDVSSGFENDSYERQFELHHFGISLTPYRGLLGLGGKMGRFLRIAARQHSRALAPANRYWFDERSPEELRGAINKTNAGRIVIEGLFQDARFFSEARDTLRSELQVLPGQLRGDAASFLKQAEADHLVALHIRGNRELSASGKVVGEINPLEKAYYWRAVQRALDMDPEAQFLIFSDGARPGDYLPLERMRLVEVPEGRRSGIVDFAAMCRCRHHIISNSTFSWWAAWLKTPERGFVVSPRPEAFGFNIVVPTEWHSV